MTLRDLDAAHGDGARCDSYRESWRESSRAVK